MNKPDKKDYGWRPGKHPRLDPGEWRRNSDPEGYEKDLQEWKLRNAVDKIKTLINPSTRLVIEILRDRELTGEQIEEASGMAQSQVSKSITRLRGHGFVSFKQGVNGDHRYRRFSVTDEVERVVGLCEEFNLLPPNRNNTE